MFTMFCLLNEERDRRRRQRDRLEKGTEEEARAKACMLAAMLRNTRQGEG